MYLWPRVKERLKYREGKGVLRGSCQGPSENREPRTDKARSRTVECLKLIISEIRVVPFLESCFYIKPSTRFMSGLKLEKLIIV